jgi:2-polyprenyl-3-methyl-5-hydroxy-6-metoxy-1,4-benzoquinol methylase
MRISDTPKQGDVMTCRQRVAREETHYSGSEMVGDLLRRGVRAIIPNCVRTRISELIRGRFLPYRKRDWDVEYCNGSWNYLENGCELVRYSAVIGCYTHYWRGGTVLDVGCGVGVLQRQLRFAGYGHYVGIDLSEQAIAQAQMLANDANTEFRCADAEVYTSQVTLDVIIFNEVLYYFAKPINVVQRLMSSLNPGGGCIVSMFRRPSSKRIWRDLDRAVRIEDAVQVRNQDGVTWDIKVFHRREHLMNTHSP